MAHSKSSAEREVPGITGLPHGAGAGVAQWVEHCLTNQKAFGKSSNHSC